MPAARYSSPASLTLAMVAARPNSTAGAIARLLSTRSRSPPPAVHASAHLHSSRNCVLEPLLTLRVCRGDAPYGGSRFRAQNPPPTAPFVRLSLTGCSDDGKKEAYGRQV